MNEHWTATFRAKYSTETLIPMLYELCQRISNCRFFTKLAAVVLMLSALLPDPSHNGRICNLPTVCVFNALTGLPCPTCGLTRSFVCLSHGHWSESLTWHPFGWILYLCAWLILLRGIIMAIAGANARGARQTGSDTTKRIENWGLAATFSMVIASGLWRLAQIVVFHHAIFFGAQWVGPR